MNNFQHGGGFKKGNRDLGGRPKFDKDQKYGNNRPAGKFSGGKGGDRGGKGGGRDDRGGKPTEMFSATCSSCQKTCQVPFRPSGDKPVYCSECFGKRASDDARGGSRDSRNDRPSFDKSPRTEQRAPAADANRDEMREIKRQLVTIEARLNRILDIINPPVPAKKAHMPEVVVREDKPVAAPVKKVAAKKVAPKKEVVKKVAEKVAAPAAKKVVKKTAPKKEVVKKAAKKVAPKKKK